MDNDVEANFMGARFVKKVLSKRYEDSRVVNGREFDVEVICEDGNAAHSIRGGRITYFLMSELDPWSGNKIAVSNFADGKWLIKCPDEDDEACIAQTFFIDKWNRLIQRKEKNNVQS